MDNNELQKLIKFHKNGDKDNSIKLAEKIISKTFIPFVFFLVSKLKLYSNNYLKQLINYTKIFDKNNNVYIYFSLANQYDLKKKYKKAYYYYELGNNLKYNLQENKYSYDLQVKKYNILKNINFKINYKSEIKLVLIVGLPRCGSTILTKMLNYNNNFKDIGENLYSAKMIDLINNNLIDPIKKLDNFIQNNYSNKTIDKTLNNYTLIGFLKSIFINCKIIHLKRNKYDQLWSNYSNLYGNGLIYTYNWESLCQEYNIYQDYMKHWNNIHNDIFNLDYEELIENPDKIMKNLFEYIDEEFNTDYNKFYKKTVSCNTSSSYQIKQPLNKKGIGKSNNYKNFMPNLNEK